MHKQAFLYVDGYWTMTLPVDITEEEIKSMYNTKKKTVTSISNEMREGGSIQWNLTTSPKKARKSAISFFGLPRQKSKTKKVVWKINFRKKRPSPPPPQSRL